MSIKAAIRYAWGGSKRWDAGIPQIIGSAIGGLAAYLLGIKVPQEILDNPSLAALVSIIIGGLVGFVVIFAGQICWYFLHHHPRTKVNPYIAIAVLGGIIVTAGIGGYFWDKSRGPIIWTWKSESWPIGIARSGDDYGVYNFGFRGTNRSEKPITRIRTFVRSNITGETIPLFFSQGQAIAPERVVIPPGESFNLDAVLPKNGPMISFEAFKKDYSNFTFSFEHDGEPPFERTFTESEVNRLIAEGRLFHEELHAKNNEVMGTGRGIRVKE